MGANVGERILVTGGAGFIGSHVVDAFIEAGHEVAIVDNLITGHRENIHPAARLYEVDIRDAEALERVFEAEQPDVVSHQAALANVRESLIDPAGYAETNVIGTLNLLEACRRHAVRKFIFASTGGAIYGEPEELPATESCPPYPLDPYGASKLACEHYLHLYRHNYDLEYCALRYANVYGPRQDPLGEAGVVAIFVGRMLHDEPVTINGDGTQKRDFTYVADIAKANVLASENGSGICNLGSGVATDINTIFRHLAKLTDCRRPAVYGPAKLGEVHTIYLDARRAHQMLNWNPVVSLTDGLQKVVDHFRAEKDGLL